MRWTTIHTSILLINSIELILGQNDGVNPLIKITKVLFALIYFQF